MGAMHSLCAKGGDEYERLPNAKKYKSYHLYTNEVVPIPDKWIELFALRLRIKKKELDAMINTSGYDVIVDGEENLDENFEIEYHFPILPIMYDFEAKDAILFIGTKFYSINSHREITRLRIVQPSGMVEARIERHFRRKLNFKNEVEMKAWRNASIILPDVKREDNFYDLNTDLKIGEGFSTGNCYYKFAKQVRIHWWARAKEVPCYNDERLAINQFRGRKESYFQVKPFEYAKKDIDMNDTLIIFRSRKPYNDWVLPEGNYLPTIGYPSYEDFWHHAHYGPCTLYYQQDYATPANIMFLKSGFLAQYWGEYTRDYDKSLEAEFFLQSNSYETLICDLYGHRRIKDHGRPFGRFNDRMESYIYNDA